MGGGEPNFTEAAELVEGLRISAEMLEGGAQNNLTELWHSDVVVEAAKACLDAADLIERLADRVNHLTNVRDGLRETLAEQRRGLAELRAMCAPEQLPHD